MPEKIKYQVVYTKRGRFGINYHPYFLKTLDEAKELERELWEKQDTEFVEIIEEKYNE